MYCKLLGQAEVCMSIDARKHTYNTCTVQAYHGVTYADSRVASSVWWPGVASTTEQFVQSCPNSNIIGYLKSYFF